MSASTKEDAKKVTVNHYTNKEAAEKIIESGFIQESDPVNGDAAFGKGTYGTSLDPDTPTEKVLDNNYDGLTNKDSSKADVVFECEVDEDRVTKANTDRDVLVVEGDISIDDVTKIHDRKTGKTYVPSK